MIPWLMLGIQIGFAALALHMLAHFVYPALGQMRQGELIVDVWLPAALVIPLLFMVLAVDGSVHGSGWPALGGPVICGVIALVMAATIGRGGIGIFGEEFVEGESIGWRLAPRLTIAALIAGLILLLLGAAHVMSLLAGLCAFAIATVLLWINTPEPGRTESSQSRNQIRAGLGMMVVLVCAFAQGLAGWFAGESERGPVVVLMLGYAAVVLALAARQHSAGLCVRLGIWSASFGVLFALGLIAMLTLFELVPETFAALLGIELSPQTYGRPPHTMDVAAGFGAFALEATALMVLTPVAVGVMRLPRWAQAAIGALLFVLVVSRVTWWLVT